MDMNPILLTTSISVTALFNAVVGILIGTRTSLENRKIGTRIIYAYQVSIYLVTGIVILSAITAVLILSSELFMLKLIWLSQISFFIMLCCIPIVMIIMVFLTRYRGKVYKGEKN